MSENIESTLPSWLKEYTGWEEAPVWCDGQPSLELRASEDTKGTADDYRVLLRPNGTVEEREYYKMSKAAEKADSAAHEPLSELEQEAGWLKFEAEYSAHSLRASYASVDQYFAHLIGSDEQLGLEIASEIALVLTEVRDDIIRAKDPTWAFFNPKDKEQGKLRRTVALDAAGF